MVREKAESKEKHREGIVVKERETEEPQAKASSRCPLLVRIWKHIRKVRAWPFWNEA